METILLIDDDLAFVFWLGRILDGAGYAAYPAKDVEDARSLVAQCGLPVDLLIINSATAGLAAFVRDLRMSRPGLEVVVVGGPAFSDAIIGPPAATLAKPERLDFNCMEEMRATVESIMLRSKQRARFSHLA